MKGAIGVRTQFPSPVNVRLSLRFQEMLADWADLFDGPSDFRRCGYVYLATRPEHVAVREKVAASVVAAGGTIEVLPAEELERLIPGTRMQGVIGGWHTPGDGTVSPVATFFTVLEACRAAGVEIREQQKLRLVETSGGIVGETEPGERISAGSIIVAAGTATRALLKGIGCDLPLAPQRGQIFRANAPRDLVSVCPLVFDMGTQGYFVTDRRGLVIGGSDSGETGAFDGSDAGRIVSLVEHRLNGLRPEDVYGGHAGIRIVSPDDLGLLGPVPGIDRVYVACGFGHHGFMHALPAAELLTERMLNGRVSEDAAAMDPARFLGPGPVSASAATH